MNPIFEGPDSNSTHVHLKWTQLVDNGGADILVYLLYVNNILSATNLSLNESDTFFNFTDLN